ncbi:MAG: type II toxin-antitoxin system RelB/DinJ family antitoxin [Propionibacteriaceae bacterium]|jgi:DNA-damage-inducible protein J|nr:type II toxin-antitoxin system RelB/DinJ family antitoxin [Propionibacteriaceae bacterium]
MTMTSLNMKVDEDVKRQADDVLSQLGLTLSAGVNVFLRKVAMTRGIPFELKLEDDEADAMALTRSLSRKALNDAW